MRIPPPSYATGGKYQFNSWILALSIHRTYSQWTYLRRSWSQESVYNIAAIGMCKQTLPLLQIHLSCWINFPSKFLNISLWKFQFHFVEHFSANLKNMQNPLEKFHLPYRNAYGSPWRFADVSPLEKPRFTLNLYYFEIWMSALVWINLAIPKHPFSTSAKNEKCVYC